MKKVILLLMIAAVVFSCKKTETTTNPVQPEQNYAEVTFNVNKIIPEATRDDFPFGLPECSDADPITANIVIQDAAGAEVFNGTVGLYMLPNDPNLYTQAIKLMLEGCDPEIPDPCCNMFYVTEFYVMDAAGNIIYAAPAEGSNAQGFLDYPDRMLNLDFEICEFMKYQVDIDVLCYEEAWYLEFGFVWFNVHEVVMCEVCFFVDVCEFSFPEGTNWAPYYTPAFDMIGIFGVTAEKLANDGVTWVPVEGLQDATGMPIYTNYNWTDGLLINGPLCVPFANYLDEVDTYRYYWHVWLPDGNGDFCYRVYGSPSFVLNDQCDYTNGIGGSDGVFELLVSPTGLTDMCAEWGSIDWVTNYIIDCQVYREVGEVTWAGEE